MINLIEQNFRDKLQYIKGKLSTLEENNRKTQKVLQETPSEPISNWKTEDPFIAEFLKSADAIVHQFDYNCIFIQLYSVVEHFTVKICYEYNKRLGTKCFEGKRRFYLQDCKPFISCQLGHNIGDDKKWEKLRYYNDFRNLIAHSLGNLLDNEGVEKPIIKKLKSDKNIIIIEEDNVAYIKYPAFLYEAIDVSLKFYTVLCDLIRKKTGEKNYLIHQ